ncbi:adenosylcobinamide-phosphate synthase CbiB [Hyphomonas sp.]|uniref:adenosylcobinamide-phosphate synthase CbiB n=1 Tax=Hyphomonas sp. TaxID=87 RepID=UPI000DFDF658|nr:adenosylcobinamide-phosphate synthase CbiB [Hyphomonas sp.]RCL89770.1 MAG: cobalamin biosynthesis protein CobD [Hyphomonas sp.]
MGFAPLILCAWGLEATIGWPQQLFRRIGHPVTWLGGAIGTADQMLNRPDWSHGVRYLMGGFASAVLVLSVAALAHAISSLLPPTLVGTVLEAAIASSLIASRSLHSHVADVAKPLTTGDISGARQAVSLIVGRDPAQLEEDGIARAALESLAENMSDGVIAPVFWGLVFGLPGIAAYKAINTLDSMIGHRSDRHYAFGGFAARLDDAANFLPARLTGLLLAFTSLKGQAWRVMLRDARRHRSTNAGWPEAAMAGALGIRLSGPRAYEGRTTSQPWLNGGARDPARGDVLRGLALYRRSCAVAFALVALVVFRAYML